MNNKSEEFIKEWIENMPKDEEYWGLKFAEEMAEAKEKYYEEQYFIDIGATKIEDDYIELDRKI